jgi:hypothetical protein
MVNARHTKPQQPSFMVPHGYKTYFINSDKNRVKFGVLDTGDGNVLFFKIIPCIIFFSEDDSTQKNQSHLFVPVLHLSLESIYVQNVAGVIHPFYSIICTKYITD